MSQVRFIDLEAAIADAKGFIQCRRRWLPHLRTDENVLASRLVTFKADFEGHSPEGFSAFSCNFCGSSNMTVPYEEKDDPEADLASFFFSALSRPAQ